MSESFIVLVIVPRRRGRAPKARAAILAPIRTINYHSAYTMGDRSAWVDDRLRPSMQGRGWSEGSEADPEQAPVSSRLCGAGSEHRRRLRRRPDGASRETAPIYAAGSVRWLLGGAN